MKGELAQEEGTRDAHFTLNGQFLQSEHFSIYYLSTIFIII